MQYYKILLSWNDGHIEEGKKQFSDYGEADRIGKERMLYSALAAGAMLEIDNQPMRIVSYEVKEV